MVINSEVTWLLLILSPGSYLSLFIILELKLEMGKEHVF